MPEDESGTMKAIAEERVRRLMRSCCCKVRACARDVSKYGGVLGFGECTYGTAIFPHPHDGHFIVSSELTRCLEDPNNRLGNYTDMRIQCLVDDKWMWAKIVWQGQKVTLCKLASTWFGMWMWFWNGSSPPHPHKSTRWSTSTCYACVLGQSDSCHSENPYKHHRQGLKVASSQDNDGRSIVVGGWWGKGSEANPFVAQPATLSVDAPGLTLAACITHARYTCGAPVLDSVTGEFVGIVRGDIKNDNLPKNGKQEIISAQELQKIPWEVAGNHISLTSSDVASLNATKQSTRWAAAAAAEPIDHVSQFELKTNFKFHGE